MLNVISINRTSCDCQIIWEELKLDVTLLRNANQNRLLDPRPRNSNRSKRTKTTLIKFQIQAYMLVKRFSSSVFFRRQKFSGEKKIELSIIFRLNNFLKGKDSI